MKRRTGKIRWMGMILLLAAVLAGCGSSAASKPENTTVIASETVKDEKAVGENKASQGAVAKKEAGENTDTENKTDKSMTAQNTTAKASQSKKTEDLTAASGKTGKSTDKDAEKDKEPAAPEPIEEPQAASVITPFEQEQTMYASIAVNVRKGPSTDFEVVGGLAKAQETVVKGQADTGWYQITYGEDVAFVSNKYLQAEKPAEEPKPVVAEAQAPQQNKNVSGVIFVGDSRTVQMLAAVGDNGYTWICQNGKGYNWLNETAMGQIDGCVGKGSKILLNLGVNDPGNINNYLTLLNAKAAEWTAAGAKVYYATVNPVWENPYVTNDQVISFNSQLASGISADIHIIDSYSYLNTIGYKLVDGLHYNTETYTNLYSYYLSCL